MARRVRSFALAVGNLPTGAKKRLARPGASCLEAGMVWSFSTRRRRRHLASFQPRPAETFPTDALSPSAVLHLYPAGRRTHRAEDTGPPRLSLVDSVCSTQSGNVLGAASDFSRYSASGMARRKIRKFLGRGL